MQSQTLRFRIFAWLAAAAMLAFSGGASADPPSRVARLGYISGAVSFSPAGEDDWDRATINRPLTTGDRLWTDARGRAEIQVGGAMIRMSADTGVSILNLDDHIAQLQLTQGTLNVRVRRLGPNQVVEVDTPNLAFTLRQPGAYRIEVDPDGDATTIFMRSGKGEAYGENASYLIDSRQPYRFTGNDLREYEYVDAPRLDDFDRWASTRDRSYDSSRSARYVSPDVIGYQDLDAYGTWRVEPNYGNVWVPNRVGSGWAPYRDGHWAWVDPWGWTWMDDAPWGFAVSHYGRWTNMRGTWGWVPGPVRTRAYYAPALVAFVGGSNFQLSISSGRVGGIAWFPLAPREVYRPSYQVSRGYFENINRSNTVVNTTVINNYYNNANVTNVVYANREVAGAVIAVPATAFVQSQPVAKAAVRMSRELVVSAPVAALAPLAPTERSVRGAGGRGEKPPGQVFQRAVVARTAPAAAPAGFAAQQQQLTARPGRPLDAADRKQLKAAPAPLVKVIPPTQIAAPTAAPPPDGPSARQGVARGKSEPRKLPAAPAISGAPAVPAPAAEPARVAPPVPAGRAPEQRGNGERRGKAEQRAQPAAPMPAPAPRVLEPKAAPPQVTPPAPEAKPPEPRGNAERRQRAQPAAPTPAPAPRVLEPKAAPPQVTLPAPEAKPPEPRGNAERRQRVQPAAPTPPPAPRVLEPKVAPPQVTPPAPEAKPPEPRGNAERRQRAQPAAPPQPPQRAVEPKPVPQVAPPVPVVPQPAQRARPEPQPRAPAAAPAAPPQQPEPPPQAQPRAQKSGPAASKPDDKKKDDDEQKDEKGRRKQDR